MLKLCYHFSSSSVCEKEEGQSNYTWVHPSCEFHSWNLGTSNTSFFPVKFWFWKLLSLCAYVMPTWAGFHNNCLPFGLHFCHLPCHIIIIITTIAIIIIIIFNHHHFFLLGVSCLLVGPFWDVPCFLIAGVCKGVRKMKKSSQIPAQAVTAHQP